MPRCNLGSRKGALAVLLVLTFTVSGRAQEAARSLTRYVPVQDRIAYAEFLGFDRHAEAWRKTALYKLLNTTRLGALVEDVAAQAIDASRKGEPGGRPSGRETVSLLERVAQKGCMVALFGKAPRETRGMFVVRDGADPALRPRLEAFAASLGPLQADRRTVQKAGRTIAQWGQGDKASCFWMEGSDALICERSALDQVLAAIEKGVPAVPSDALAKPEAGFEPIAVAFADIAAVGKLPPNAAAWGVDGLKSIDARWGFQDVALKTVIRLTAPAPRRGILALFDQPAFDRDSLPNLPAGLKDFLVVSLDPAASFDRIVAVFKATNPGQAAQLDAAQQAVRQALGVDVRKELLPHLGPYWSIYRRPQAGQPAPAAAPIPWLATTVVVPVDDQAAVTRALEPILRMLVQQLAAVNPAAGPDAARLRKVEGPNTTFTLELPRALRPPGPMEALAPTVIVAKRQLILAGRSDAAEAALALVEKNGPRWMPTEAFIPMARQLPAKMMFLDVTDPRETLPPLIESLPMLVESFKQAAAQRPRGARGGAPAEFPIRIDPALVPRAGELSPHLFPGSFAMTIDDQRITLVARDSIPSPSSPGTMGVAVALLLPAVQAAREAARRSQCVNNLKQIGLALHNYHATHGSYPRRAVADRNGKALLSWRVTILPFLGQEDLYNKFKLDEPWDSPHNRQLLESMPAAYACPSRPRAEPFTTTYRAFGGPLSLLQADRDVKREDVTDGAGNTLAVVEATQSVPWTKPDELPFDPKPPAPLLGAGSSHAGGFNALFADGSVRFLKLSINPDALRALVTRAGGEAIPADAF
jgi:prepilin-type processing-associated H-X9-DG protein